MVSSFHLFRTAACDEFTWKPRLIRWYFAHVTCRVSTNMDLGAEAKLRATNNSDHPPTDFDDPSIAKNVISDPLSCRDTTDTFGKDGDQCGSLH